MAEQEETRAEKAPEEAEVQEVSLLDQLLAKIDAVPPPQAARDQIGSAIGYFLEAVSKSAERPERVDGAH